MRIPPLKSDKKIRTFVFSFDEKYAKYFSVVLLSLIRYADKSFTYDLIVLYDNLSDGTMEKLRELIPEGFSLRFFDVGDCVLEYFGDLSGSTVKGKWVVSTFYDLLVPLIMPDYEYVLYCDSDIVFQGDPGELFETPLGGRPLAVVRDAFLLSFALLPENKFLQNQNAFLCDTLGITEPENYFNGGVLLFRVPSIDKEEYLERAQTAFTFPELPTVDQDVMNYIFNGNIALMPQRFNLQTAVLAKLRNSSPETKARPDAAAMIKAAEDPVIIHYTTEKKPWLYPDCEMGDRFWKEAERSSFYEQILRENIDVLQKKETVGPAEYAFSSFMSKITRGRLQRHFLWRIQDTKRLKRLKQMLKACCLFMLAIILTGCAAKAPSVEQTSLVDAVFSGDPETLEPRIDFSLGSGVYDDEQLTVTLSAPEGCSVAFTQNGKLPTAGDDSGQQTVEITLKSGGTGYLIGNRDLMVYPEFPGSFMLDDPSLPSGCVLRAAAISQNGEVGTVWTQVYFLGGELTARFNGCLVISIVTDPSNLLDYDTGILATGAIYNSWKQTDSALEHIERKESWEIQSNITQHGKAWERPCILQIFDGDASPAVCTGAGIRVTGNASRVANQKSFNIYFRDSYGSSTLKYELFDGIEQYKSFRLRSGGNNADWLKFKDAFLQELVAGRNFAEADSRPAVLFLNGEYWGPYLLSEKVSARMLSDHYGVDKDQVIFMKEGELEDGEDDDVKLYDELMSYKKKDLNDPAVWQEFCQIMDVRSMADYCAARIYFGDADWRADKNDLLWRTRDGSYNEGRWQYILYDVEFSSDMYGDERTAAQTDHFRIAQEQYPLFAAAIKNPEFYSLFLESLKEIGGGDCNYENVRKTLDAYLDVWEPLMPDYYKRFGDSRDLWNTALNRTKAFFKTRYELLLPFVEG